MTAVQDYRKQSTISSVLRIREFGDDHKKVWKGWKGWFQQFYVVVKKNFIQSYRNWMSTLTLLFLMPLIVMLILLILQAIYHNFNNVSVPHPPISVLGGFPACTGGGFQNANPCISLIYTVTDASLPISPAFKTQLDTIMTVFAAKNVAHGGAPLILESQPLSSLQLPMQTLGIVFAPSDLFVYNYVITNPNISWFAVAFEPLGDTLSYNIWYNNTLVRDGDEAYFGEPLLNLMRGIDEAAMNVAILNNATASPFSLNVSTKPWPTLLPGEVSSRSQQPMISTFLPTFTFAAFSLLFMRFMIWIVSEKERGHRLTMHMMGLCRSVYWATWFFTCTAYVLIMSLLLIAIGAAFQIRFFLVNNFFAIFLTFFLFGISMITMAMWMTTFCRTPQAAVMLGSLLFAFGYILQAFFFGSGFMGYIFWLPASPALWIIMSIFPFFSFGKILLDMSRFAEGRYNTTSGLYVSSQGFLWQDLYQPLNHVYIPTYKGVYPNVTAPIVSWYAMMIVTVIFLIFIWYFDTTLSNDCGARQSFFFLFKPSYWGHYRHNAQRKRVMGMEASSKSVKQKQATDSNNTIDDIPLDGQPIDQLMDEPVSMEDAEVQQQRLIVEQLDKAQEQARRKQTDGGDDNDSDGELALEDNGSLQKLLVEYPMRIVHLSKAYRTRTCTKKKEKIAVNSLCLAMRDGEMLALLGQNGAGKSTTISMLSGLSSPTGGDAVMFGHSILEEATALRSIIGVCPQFDNIFDDLTAYEHLELFCGLKGIPRDERQIIIKEILEAVHLWKVRHVLARTFSGGMKRRLSVGICTVGYPKIVFLDEPTTGMDPFSRRYVWDYLEEFKEGRVVILTTHSMEEAEVLSDRVAVMVKGELKALGTAAQLKAKFGTGYRLSLITDPDKIELACRTVNEFIPEATLQDDAAGSLIFHVPKSSMGLISVFLRYLNSSKNYIYKEWGLTQSTLEEIFLQLIRSSSAGSVDDLITKDNTKEN